MPRLTDRSRQSRRDDIAQAALRVLAREGVARASIAQIVEESGRSSGAIYSHFRSKAELALYIADHALGWRIDALERFADEGGGEPLEILRLLLDPQGRDAPPTAVVLQFWAEATTDADLHRLLEAKLGGLRHAFERGIAGWAAERAPGDADALAARVAASMVAVAQGWIASTALLGWQSARLYLDGLAEAFAAPDTAGRIPGSAPVAPRP